MSRFPLRDAGLIARAACLALSVLATSAAAQVSLPDEPDQPRPVDRLPFTITRSGTWYLTGTLQGEKGIVISASHVTLDLRGHRLIGTFAPHDGVSVDGNHEFVRVVNGTVSHWGGSGLDLAQARGPHVEDIEAMENIGWGAVLGDRGTASRSQFRSNGMGGLLARTQATVLGCSLEGNGVDGVVLGEAATLTDCTVRLNARHGILSTLDATLTENRVTLNGRDGIVVGNHGRVSRNECHDNGRAGDGAGIHVTGRGNRITANNVVGNDRGLAVDGGENLLQENLVHDNLGNYDIAPFNDVHLMLCELPEIIDWPATVTLAWPLSGASGDNGILVRSSDVTIDLDGHSLVGKLGSLDGIHVQRGLRNIAVRNGDIREWGGSGVEASLAHSLLRIQGVEASRNGLDGFRVPATSELTDCRVLENGWARQNPGSETTPVDGAGLSAGDRSTVLRCVAMGNVGDGIRVGEGGSVVDTLAQGNTGDGLRAGKGSDVARCTAQLNDGHGVRLDENGTISGCVAKESGRDGIRVVGGCHVFDCTATANGEFGAGIRVLGQHNRIEGNRLSGNTVGLEVTGTRNLIVRNTATANGDDFSLEDGNAHGSLIRVTGSGDVTITDAWANFIY